MPNKPLFLKIVSVVIYLTAFVSVCLFVNTQMVKYDYFIYLYGTSAAPGSKALVKVLSRDGELVSNPVVYVNGIRQLSSLIDLRPDMKEIKVVFGRPKRCFRSNTKMSQTIILCRRKSSGLRVRRLKRRNLWVSGTGKFFFFPKISGLFPNLKQQIGRASCRERV